MSKTTDAIIDQMNNKVKEPKWFLLLALGDLEGLPCARCMGCFASKLDAENKVEVNPYTDGPMYYIIDSYWNSYQIIDLRTLVYE